MSPFLKMGATFASFQSFGTWPVCNDVLNIISSIGEIWWLNSFRTLLYFDHNHNVIYNIQCKYTLTEYNKYIIVTVEILLKPQGSYNEDHQDMKNRH